MRTSVPFFMIVITAIFLFACTETKTEAEYYKLAYDQYNSEKYDEAVTNFKSLIENYPKGEKVPNAIFMVGFICANHLKNYDEAKTYYNLFIEKYPEHELVSSAKYELETMGKDINELDIFKNIEQEVKKEEQANAKKEKQAN